MYKKEMARAINKRLTDEISAAAMYLHAAGYIKDIEIAEEIRKHAEEEFTHFSELMSFANSHDIFVVYEFDKEVTKNVPRETNKIISLIQKLEKKAIADYKSMVILARENYDLEAEKLFKHLMEEEIKHFDDIAQVTGETRKLGESGKTGLKEHERSLNSFGHLFKGEVKFF